MPMLEGMDFIQMRRGAFYVVDVTTRAIEIEIGGLDSPLKIKTKNIAWIIYRNPYGYQQDRIQLISGGELRGTVTTKRLSVKSDDLGKLKLATSEMLTVHFASNHDLDDNFLG